MIVYDRGPVRLVDVHFTKVLMRIASLRPFLVQWKKCVGISSMRKTKLTDVPQLRNWYLRGWETNLRWKCKNSFQYWAHGRPEVTCPWCFVKMFGMVLMMETLAINGSEKSSESMCLMPSFPTGSAECIDWFHGASRCIGSSVFGCIVCNVLYAFIFVPRSKSEIARGTRSLWKLRIYIYI